MATASVTEIGLAAPGRHRITVDDFYRLAEVGILRADDRVELIEGEVFDMSPIGILHAAVVAAMAAAFHESFGRSRRGDDPPTAPVPPARGGSLR